MAEAAILVEMFKCVGSVIPQCIPQELKDKLTRPVSYVLSYSSNIEDIKNEIDNLAQLKVEVEVKVSFEETNGKNIKHEVQDWLKGTHAILEKFDTEIKGNLDNRESNSCFCGHSCEIGKMLDDIKKLLVESRDFRSYGVSYPGDPPPNGSIYTLNIKSLPSRDQLLEKILKALKDSSINVITMYGIPGGGKTTMLKEIVKRVEDDELFQVITPVINISEVPDIKKIQKVIASRIRLELGDEENWSAKLHHQLKSRLVEDKRILLVLDDICTEFTQLWKEVGIPFLQVGNPSCTILMSSRKFDVHKKIDENRHFRLGSLDAVEAKSLFRAGLTNQITNEDYMSEEYLAMEDYVLQKCDGLPSAITELAHVLKDRWSARHDVVDQLRSCYSSEVDCVYSRSHLSIKQSYNLLEIDERKKIFLLICCLSPPGTSISIEDFIRHVIGFSSFGVINSLEDFSRKANRWVDAIKSLSLFESKDGQGCIIIPSVIRDVAISIASEEKYLLLLEEGAPLNVGNFESYTIISIRVGSNQGFLNYLAGDMLEGLFLEGESSCLLTKCYLKDGYFTGMKKLRVLCLAKMELSIPRSIESLHNLVTLSMEYCEIEDASPIIILVCLKVLSFRGSTIKVYPTHIEKLSDLRSLDLTDCCFGGIQVDVVGNLSHLEGLYMSGCKFSEHPTSEVVTEDLVRRLSSLACLHALEIEIPSTCLQSVDNSSIGEKLDRFKICVGCKALPSYKEFYFKQLLLLEEIDVKMYIRKSLLEKTDCLRLVKIPNLKRVVYDLDSYLVQLKCLHISHSEDMACIVCTAGMPVGSKILPDLEILTLEQLDSLKDICFPHAPQNWCSNLKELKLLKLKNLKLPVMSVDHACKLTVVEIKDCASLEHIFSTIVTAEVSGAAYDFPSLKKLELQRLPTLNRLLAGIGSINQFFHEKMNLPVLQELYLSSLGNVEKLWELAPSDPASVKETFSKLQYLKLSNIPGLEYVWDRELCSGSLSFRSLKKLEIIDCEGLKSLCPTTVAAVLVKLESLEITSCDKLEEVIMTEANGNNVITFDSLRRLKLKNLSSLQWFYKGSNTFEFPSLKELVLCSLPMMLSFLGPHDSSTPSPPTNVNAQGVSSSVTNQMPFLKEIKCSSLEHLELCDMEQIEKLVEEGHDAFPKLKTLTVKNLGPVLQGLQWNSLTNLRSLVIHGSSLGMRSMLSSADVLAGEGLPSIEYMNIEDCKDLENIVSISKDCDLTRRFEGAMPMFLHLKHIKLRNLAKLTAFKSGPFVAEFPALERVEMHNCPSLKLFSEGELTTLKLRFVQVDDKEVYSKEEIKLNDFRQNSNDAQSNAGSKKLGELVHSNDFHKKQKSNGADPCSSRRISCRRMSNQISF